MRTLKDVVSGELKRGRCAWVAGVIDLSRGSPSCHGGSPGADSKRVEQCQTAKHTKGCTRGTW